MSKENGESAILATAEARFAKAAQKHSELIHELLRVSGDDPMRVRLSINSIMCDLRAMGMLLIQKGIISFEELRHMQAASLEAENKRLDSQVGKSLIQRVEH